MLKWVRFNFEMVMSYPKNVWFVLFCFLRDKLGLGPSSWQDNSATKACFAANSVELSKIGE